MVAMTTDGIERIVVIGAGQAGGWVCRTLREDGFAGKLSVVADEPEDFYERPPLSKAVLTAKAALPRLFPVDVVAGMAIDWYRPCTAVAVDRDRRRVHLRDGRELAYDRLVLATGASARLPVAHWRDLPAVQTLRTWADACRLRKALVAGRRLGVVGGGWIGLEVAASARALGLEVEVFEAQATLCARSIDPVVSDWLRARHEAQGVVVHLGVAGLELAAGRPAGVWLHAEDLAPRCFDLVLVGTGVRFNTDLARRAGLVCDQGIVVDPLGRTSDPTIHAVGDVAQHPAYGRCLQSWAFARNQAVVAAKAILGHRHGYDEPPWFWSDQYDANIQILGLPGQGVRFGCRGGPSDPVFFALDSGARLVQMVAVNQPRLIKLGKRWMTSGRVLDAEALADPGFDPMRWR